MIAKGLVPARSMSERLEQLMALDIRNHVHKLRPAGIQIPDFVRDRPADIQQAVRARGTKFAKFFENGLPRSYTADRRFNG